LYVITYNAALMVFTVEIYVAQNGRQPFAEWFGALRDIRTQARIEARLRRLSLGLLGDHRPIGGGVIEIRLDFGPGFRIYFTRVAADVLLLLCGGDKNTQQGDIERAIS
jgi:putative addiction module killer protein